MARNAGWGNEGKLSARPLATSAEQPALRRHASLALSLLGTPKELDYNRRTGFEAKPMKVGE